MIPEAPPFPELLDYLWTFFREVSLGIASNGMSPAQITWRDVSDWSRLSGNELEPWESRAIVALGLIRANVLSEKTATESKAPSPTAPPPKGRRRSRK